MTEQAAVARDFCAARSEVTCCDLTAQRPIHDYHALWKRRGERMSRLLTELCQTRHERDMLARRCAEQAAHIARLLAPADTPKATIHDAIAKMQAAGIR